MQTNMFVCLFTRTRAIDLLIDNKMELSVVFVSLSETQKCSSD